MTTTINVRKIIIFILIVLFSASIISCATSPKSTILITGNKRAPIAVEAVKVLPALPDGTEMIGIITAKGVGGMDRQMKLETAMEELKRQAALIGANAVVLMENDDKGLGKQDSKGININIDLRPVTFKAKALYIKAQ
jgi:uncharacterized protein YbjQ (UPF0145 family)